MGLFLQTALIPGCDEQSARRALEEVSKDPEFSIDLKECQYAQCPKGTQVLIKGNMGFDTLAKALSDALAKPVMLLFIYDDDFWGYDFYMGKEEDHFNTIPDYFGKISPAQKRYLEGNFGMLAKWFDCSVQDIIGYLIHWSDYNMDKLQKMGKVSSRDVCTYGDCWQMADFAARLGFLWPFDENEDAPGKRPKFPTLGEILDKRIPSINNVSLLKSYPIINKLPSAFSLNYIKELIKEQGVRDFGFEKMTPLEIIECVDRYKKTVSLSQRDHLCQRLSVLAAFSTFWLEDVGFSWGYLDNATYEPLYGTYEKPTDIYVLRARAAITDFTKNHRASKDLERLKEIDPENADIYERELNNWEKKRQKRKRKFEKAYQSVHSVSAEKKAANDRRIQRRLDRVLKKQGKNKEK